MEMTKAEFQEIRETWRVTQSVGEEQFAALLDAVAPLFEEPLEALRALLGKAALVVGPDDVLVLRSDQEVTPSLVTIFEAAVPRDLRERLVVIDPSLEVVHVGERPVLMDRSLHPVPD